jgi:hypothetical protein
MCSYRKVIWDPSLREVYIQTGPKMALVRTLSDIFNLQFTLMMLFYGYESPQPYQFSSYIDTKSSELMNNKEFYSNLDAMMPKIDISSYKDVQMYPMLSNIAPKGSILRKELVNYLHSTTSLAVVPPFFDNELHWDVLVEVFSGNRARFDLSFDPVYDDCRIIDLTKIVVSGVLCNIQSSGEGLYSAMSTIFYGKYTTTSKVKGEALASLIYIFKQRVVSVFEGIGVYTLMLSQ